MRLPLFRKVGDILKDKFDGASRVNPGRSTIWFVYLMVNDFA